MLLSLSYDTGRHGVVIMTQTPIRASNLQRAYLCPPSVWREQGIPNVGSSPDASEGTKLHAAIVRALTLGDYSGLSEEQIGVVKWCVRYANNVVAQYPKQIRLLEKPIPVLDRNGESILSEREITPDFVVLVPELSLGIVIDWKTGRNAYPFPAMRDLQLLTYALAVHHFYKVNIVHAHRFHPRVWDETQSSSVQYGHDEGEWDAVEDKLKKIIARSTPTAKAKAGATQCNYCKAKICCPECQEWSDPVGGDVVDVTVSLNESTRDQIALVLATKERINLLKKRYEQAESLAKALAQKGEPIVSADGTGRWVLKEGGGSREIKNAAAARFALAEYIPVEAFAKACAVKVGELEKVFRIATGLKGKNASEKLNEILGGLVEFKPNAPSLVFEAVNSATESAA